jgi:hypothetical protein
VWMDERMRAFADAFEQPADMACEASLREEA